MTISLTISFASNDIATDRAALLSLLHATGTGTTPPVVPPPTATDFFPADPTTAPLSPENSTIQILNGAVAGRPYLVDSNASIWTLSIVNGLGVAHVGNTVVKGGGSADGINQLLVRQGQVWCILATGPTQWWNPGMASLYNGTMPPAWTTPGGGAAQPPTVPTAPTPSAVAPGSSGKIIQCGSGQAIATLTAALATAVAGDTIKVAPGTYQESPPAWTVPLLIDLGGATFDATGMTATLARGKGVLVPGADSIIQNGTVVNAAMDQTVGQLTSAIRPDDGCGYLTIKNMALHNNQCGIGHGGFNCVIDVSGSDISSNGLKVNTGSLTHNLYTGVECVKLTLTNVVSTAPNEAHAVKHRGAEMIVNGGTFEATNGSCFDRPNGSATQDQIIGATLIKQAGSPDHKIIDYAEESQSNGLAGMLLKGGAIQALCDNPLINGAGGTITIDPTCALSGNPITAAGVVVARS